MREQSPKQRGGIDNVSTIDAYSVAARKIDDMLIDSVRRHDTFSNDSNDEFTVTRANGEKQGIFKVWADQIIPRLERPQDTPEVWADQMRAQPFRLYQSLERWRAYASQQDRRLQDIFAKRQKPHDTLDKTVELFNRMFIAFSYAAPFYNLEALVVDNRKDASENPIEFRGDDDGGALDVVAMMLPAAFADYVTASSLEWNGLNWESIEAATESMRQEFLSLSDEQAGSHIYARLAKIAHRAHVSPEEVLFAANLLEFIPVSVAGKKADSTVADASRLIDKALGQSSRITTGQVAKDANALIRFLNWMPAQRNERNFEGKDLSYAAVCDTADELVGILLSEGDELLDGQSLEEFKNILAPQLSNIDAASARGRLILQLFNDGAFSEAFYAQFEKDWASFYDSIAVELEEISAREAILPLDARATAFMVGGKAEGLRRAMDIIGEEHVLEGYVISAESAYDWLMTIEGVPTLLDMLSQSTNHDEKLVIADNICERIFTHPIPHRSLQHIQDIYGEAIVLRSSSFDEDVDIIGSAPGVYDSVVNIDSQNLQDVDRGFRMVIASFFSDKAVSFRELKGLMHLPLMSVIVQAYKPGRGGTLFVHEDGTITLNVARTAEAINELSAGDNVEKFVLANGSTHNVESDMLSDTQVQLLRQFARRAEAVSGACDMEFVIDDQGAVKVLQLRALDHTALTEKTTRDLQPTDVIHIESADSMPSLAEGAVAHLYIGEGVDLEKFQGTLFRWIISHESSVAEITLAHSIPPTCHFANIVNSLGIRVSTAHEL